MSIIYSIIVGFILGIVFGLSNILLQKAIRFFDNKKRKFAKITTKYWVWNNGDIEFKKPAKWKDQYAQELISNGEQEITFNVEICDTELINDSYCPRIMVAPVDKQGDEIYKFFSKTGFNTAFIPLENIKEQKELKLTFFKGLV